MSITVTVTDMSCDGCEDIVEGAVADVAGVESVEADRESQTVTVDGDANEDAVVEAIDFAGYNPSQPATDDDDGAEAASEEPDEESEEAAEETDEDSDEATEEAADEGSEEAADEDEADSEDDEE